MKKLYALFVPLLAVTAFAAMPAAAQAAEPEWEVCKEVAKETGKWETIKCEKEKAKSNFEWVKPVGISAAVLTNTKNVAGKVALLENEAKTAGIECKKVTDESWIWNRASRGRDINEVLFTECKGVLGLAKCTVTTPIVVEAYTRLELEGTKIYNKFFPVDNQPFTEITLAGAECPAPGTSSVTGTARGEIPLNGSKQKFNGGEYTLLFLGEKSEFTGEVETEGAAKKEGVRVN